MNRETTAVSIFYLLLLLLSDCTVECTSGSGGEEVCDLSMCTTPSERNLVNLSQLQPVYFPNCSLTCENINTECNLCLSPSNEYPKSSIFFLNIQETQLQQTNVTVVIEDVSESFTSFQISSIAVNRHDLPQIHYGISVDVTEFACSQISISYTLQDSTAIQGPTLCLNAVPSSPTDITYEVTRGCDNATINVEWNKPENYSFWVTDYVLMLNKNRAIPECIELTINKTQNETSTIIGMISPLFDCGYMLSVFSYPGGKNEVLSLEGIVPAVDVSYDCESVFDYATTTYNVTLLWTIENNECSVISNIVRFEITLRSGTQSSTLNRLIDPKEVASYHISPDNRTQDKYHHTFSHQLIRPMGGYQFGFLTKYNREPDYVNRFIDQKCEVAAPPIPPEDVTVISISNFTITESRFSNFTISWNAPRFTNGDVQYQLWIGSDQLKPNIVQAPHSGRLVFKDNLNGSQRSVRIEDIFLSRFNPILYAQVIATNNWCQSNSFENRCYSNWSRPLEINTTMAQIVNEKFENTVTPTTTSTVLNSGTIEVTPSTSVDNTRDDSFIKGVPSNLLWPMVGVAGALLITITLLVVIVVCCCCFGGRLKKDISMVPMLDLGPSINLSDNTYAYSKQLLYDDWEIPRHILEVYKNETLGSGCFGEVCKGGLQIQFLNTRRRLSHSHQLKYKHATDFLPVAIKTLKKTADGKERDDFLKEIETMKMVSETDSELKRFVVNMLGCCRLEEPILLVVEFVQYGDLLNYIRSMKKRTMATNYPDGPHPYLEPNGIYSQLEPRSQVDDKGHLTSRNLLDFARQIVAGMEFLSSLDIIHRDLACRNILVGANKELKISDFGLARMVPQDEVYTLTNHGRFPLRWMALESIFQREFTSSSDVWSYGVVLWEICTMGAFPYSSLSEKDLLKLLKRGYRLDQPENCSQEIYEVMHQCWHPDPRGRPKFADLHKLFDHFLAKHTEDLYPYIDMDSTTTYSFDHLKPKSLTDYQAQQIKDGVLNIDEEDYRALSTVDSSGYGSLCDFSPESYTLSEGQTHHDKYMVESGCCVNVSSRSPGHCSSQPNTVPTPPTIHIGLYRLQGQEVHGTPFEEGMLHNRLCANQLAQNHDKRLQDEESLMERVVKHEAQMLDPSLDDFYADLWLKKLSTITEVSYEDYSQDDTRDQETKWHRETKT